MTPLLIDHFKQWSPSGVQLPSSTSAYLGRFKSVKGNIATRGGRSMSNLGVSGKERHPEFFFVKSFL